MKSFYVILVLITFYVVLPNTVISSSPTPTQAMITNILLNTPIITPTVTLSVTPKNTPTLTQIITPTNKPTLTPKPTFTPSPSFSPTPWPTISPIIGPVSVVGHTKLKVSLVYQYPAYSPENKVTVIFLGFLIDNTYAVSIKDIQIDYRYKNSLGNILPESLFSGTARIDGVSPKSKFVYLAPAVYLTDADAITLDLNVDFFDLKVELVDIRALR